MSPPAPADAIVVLGHRVEPDGRPGVELALRLERGLSLLRAARAPLLVCSGGRDPDEPVSAADAMVRVALAAGIDARRLLASPQPLTTLEEAVALRREFSTPRGWRRLVLVTSAYHVPRAIAAFALAHGPEVEILAEPVAGPSSIAFGDPEVVARRESEAFARLRSLAEGLSPGDVDGLAARVRPSERRQAGLPRPPQDLVDTVGGGSRASADPSGRRSGNRGGGADTV